MLIKYGKPKKKKTEILTNGLGTEFKSLNIYWSNKTETAFIQERYKKVNESILSIESIAHQKRNMHDSIKKTIEKVEDL